jgi:hypothetical protein
MYLILILVSIYHVPIRYLLPNRYVGRFNHLAKVGAYFVAQEEILLFFTSQIH